MNNNFRPAARMVIVNEKKQILLAKHKNHWAIPGGGVDFGESLQGTISRESLEELNRVAQMKDIIFIQDYLGVVKGEEKHCLEYFCSIGNNSDFENVVNDWKNASYAFELEEIAWFDSDNFPDNFMPVAFPTVFQEYIKNTQNFTTQYISTL